MSFDADHTRGAHPSPLRVSTWNVLADSYINMSYYPHLDEHPDSDTRRDHVVAVIRRLGTRSDVIVLQEVEEHVAHSVTNLLDTWDVTWVQRPGRPDGSLLAARRALLAQARSVTFGVDRVGVAADIEHAGTKMCVVGTHLSWDETDAVTHRGVLEARELTDTLSGTDVVVVAGDLNDQPGGPVLDVFEGAGYLGFVNNAPTAVVNSSEAVTIDHIYVRGGDPCALHSVYPADRALPDSEFPSDHTPLTGEVAVGDLT